jgi:hypothetical protein
MLRNGKGLFGSNPIASGPATQQAPQTKPREGPSTTRRIAGILGDAMLGYAGQPGQYGPMMAQRRMLEEQRGFAVQQGKTERDGRMQDWYAQQDYARANPQAPEPTTLQRNYEYLGGINPEIAQDYLAAQARDPMDEYVSVPIPGRGTYVGPRSGMAQAMGGSGVPSGPVGNLTYLDEPTMQNTPPPQLGASGHPSVISRQQYDVLVRESDGNSGAVNDYLARRGIQVRN